MTDPYKVLGVSPDAADDEIKKAYRDLARKYHPDNYVNNPLADLVQEKMKEINEAYDTIQKQRAARKSGGEESRYYGGAQTDRKEYAEVRTLINEGNIADAQRILESIPLNVRGAEWNFLNGCVLTQKGWYYEAQKYFETACYMDPSNQEYRDALNNIKQNADNYGRSYRSDRSGCSACDICSTLVCADCCCECMGGDLIGCC